MLNKEIENLLSCDSCKLKECISCEIIYTDRKKIREYIEQLEQKANKYDSLVKKIEDKIEDLGISDVDIYLQCELQELLKEAEE